MSTVGAGPIRWHDILMTTDTSAVAAGDVLADTQEISAQFFTPMKPAQIVQSLHVFDGDDQIKSLDVVLLNKGVSLGTENQPVSINDANALFIRGIVKVGNSASGDWVDLVNSAIAIPQFNPFVICADYGTSMGLWAAVIAREAGTWATSNLRLRIGVVQ